MNKKVFTKVWQCFALASVFMVTSGCSKGVLFTATSAQRDNVTNSGLSGTAAPVVPDSTTINNNVTNVTQNICDPFGSETMVGPENGLSGKIYYLLNGKVGDYNGVIDMMAKSSKLDANLFLSELAVRTRIFDQGFPTQDQTLIKLPDGRVLTEFFALSLNSKLHLAAWDKPGLKQFALLTDDGSILSVDTGTGMRPLIDNDGNHPTRLLVAKDTVFMDHTSSVPIHVDYFQGPRLHIALMLLWRDIADVNGTGEANSTILDPDSLDEPLDGREGNELFFNPSTKPSTPQAAWYQLRARGWDMVPAINYLLPGSGTQSTNPCSTKPLVL